MIIAVKFKKIMARLEGFELPTSKVKCCICTSYILDINFNIVDLPHPDGPTRTTVVPGLIVSEIFFKTFISEEPIK